MKQLHQYCQKCGKFFSHKKHNHFNQKTTGLSTGPFMVEDAIYVPLWIPVLACRDLLSTMRRLEMVAPSDVAPETTFTQAGNDQQQEQWVISDERGCGGGGHAAAAAAAATAASWAEDGDTTTTIAVATTVSTMGYDGADGVIAPSSSSLLRGTPSLQFATSSELRDEGPFTSPVDKSHQLDCIDMGITQTHSNWLYKEDWSCIKLPNSRQFSEAPGALAQNLEGNVTPQPIGEQPAVSQIYNWVRSFATRNNQKHQHHHSRR